MQGSIPVYTVLITLALGFTAYGYAEDYDTISVGVLAQGHETVAIQHSIHDVNLLLEDMDATWRLEAVYPDGVGFTEFITQSHEDGIVVFVGPGDAASLLRAKVAIADIGGGAVYVGCCVPSTHLNVLEQNDHVFAMVPDVLDQAAAIAAAMEHAGVEYAVPVYSGDLESSQMRAAVAVHFDGTMDSGVVMPPDTIDYVAVASSISEKIRLAGDNAAVLVLDQEATGDLMAVSSDLAEIRWFGTGHLGLPDLDEAVHEFAEDVGYTVPRFGTTYTNIIHINTDYTIEEWSGYDAIQLLAYTISNPTTEFVPFFGQGSYLVVQGQPSVDAYDIAAALPTYAAKYAGNIGSVEMGNGGGLASATYMLLGMVDGTWVKQAVYNPPISVGIGTVTVNDRTITLQRFEHTHQLYDVYTVGALFPLSGSLAAPAEQRVTAARLATALINNVNDGLGLDWYADLRIEDTNADPDTALDRLQKLNRLGIKMVVGPSTSTSAAAVKDYAQEHNIVLLSPSTSSSLSIPGDNLYRVSPPSDNEAIVLTKMLERDGITHAVALYRQDLWGSGLIQGLNSEFGGSLTVKGYSSELANSNALDYSAVVIDIAEDVQALVGEHGGSSIGVIMIGFDESANILEAASNHPILESVQWYGSAGNVKRSAIGDNPEALAFAEKVGYRGPILMINDELTSQNIAGNIAALHPGEQIDPYVYVTFDLIYVASLALGASAGDMNTTTAWHVLNSTISRINVFVAGDDGLDRNGDIANRNYDIWQVIDGRWHNILVYDFDREKFIREVVVGLPIPITGVQSDVRFERNTAAHLAVQATNHMLEARDADWRLVLDLRNTAGSPERVLEVIESMHQDGIHMLLGLPTDGELAMVQDYIRENNMLVLNCCSTSQHLATPDNIFRLVPNNTVEASELNMLMADSSVEHLVVVYRDDAYGLSMSQAVADVFEGDIVEIPYNSRHANYEVLDHKATSTSVANSVHHLATVHDGMQGVAVLLVGYGESAGILASASEHDILTSIPWYGTSGSAKRPALVANYDAARFAESVGYAAPLLTEPEPVGHITTLLSHSFTVPTTYTYTTYDSVTLLAAAVGLAGSDDVGAVAAAIPIVASQIPGTIGALALNANGDLDRSSYDIWHIRNGVWVSDMDE